MGSSKNPLLSALAIFKNIHNEEVIRSVHIYGIEDGKEKGIEREFMFSMCCCNYVEMVSEPLLKMSRVRVSKLSEGQVIGVWLCIFAFDANSPPLSISIPSILVISRNPKLITIPTLTDDLQKVYHLMCTTENNRETSPCASQVSNSKNDDDEYCNDSVKSLPVFIQDLNCLPYSIAGKNVSENHKNDQGVASEAGATKKKKRAATEHIARISLSDLAKYFDLPIAEASRNLKVGVTVLKRKCRELGIPRWPHRKIKSLDTLIQNLQEEAKRQELENKAAASMAVLKRQKMLEREKQGIETKPFMEIQSETKRFRQDVFKRRHRARAAFNQKC